MRDKITQLKESLDSVEHGILESYRDGSRAPAMCRKHWNALGEGEIGAGYLLDNAPDTKPGAYKAW